MDTFGLVYQLKLLPRRSATATKTTSEVTFMKLKIKYEKFLFGLS